MEMETERERERESLSYYTFTVFYPGHYNVKQREFRYTYILEIILLLVESHIFLR